jgi:hypothetical protein
MRKGELDTRFIWEMLFLCVSSSPVIAEHPSHDAAALVVGRRGMMRRPPLASVYYTRAQPARAQPRHLAS